MSQERPRGARPERTTPRSAVAPQAIYVSQFTAPALFGFKTERAFLEFVVEHDVRRTKAGKTVLVEVEELRSVLRHHAITGGDLAEPKSAGEPDSLGSPDDILARMGLRRTA
jgi:hypothetical protein